MPLVPIQPSPNTAEQCATQIQRLILAATWSLGERLPPERQLATELQVNRTTVRKALASLVQRGLLRVRQGRGYEVCDFRAHAGPSLLPALLRQMAERGLSPSTLRDLLDIRRAIAHAVLTRLSGTDTAASPALLSAREAFIRLAEGHAAPADLARADAEFVRQVVLLSGSTVFALFLNPLDEALSELPSLVEAMYADPHRIREGHDEMIAWLDSRERDVSLILEPMRRRDELITTLAVHQARTPR